MSQSFVTPPKDNVRLPARSLGPRVLDQAGAAVAANAARAAQSVSSGSCSQSPFHGPGSSWVASRVPRVTASIP